MTLTDEGAEWLALRAKALGHERRMKLVQMLLNGPCGTEELKAALGDVAHTSMLHHLDQLLYAGFVTKTREGLLVEYQLNREELEHFAYRFETELLGYGSSQG